MASFLHQDDWAGRSLDSFAVPVRSEALTTITEAIRSIDLRAVVIRGPAGAGKTWLAQAALAGSQKDQVLCGSGKFSEYEGQAALGPIMAALSSLLGAALDRFYDTQAGMASLADTLGVDLDVLIGAGLSLQQLENGKAAPALADHRLGIARIAAATVNLLQWTEKLGVPRALLIDDWNRAAPDAIDLLGAIGHMVVAQPLTLLLTEREQNSEAPSPVDQALLLSLEPLDDEEVTALLSQRLGTREQAELARSVLGDSIPRLPFDLMQIADALIRDAVFRRSGRGWVVDSAKATRLTFDAASVVERLAPPAREMAVALALWGDAAALETFSRALGGDDGEQSFRATLLELQSEGIVNATGGVVAFCHDRLREAAIQAPPELRAKLAAAMAERIPANVGPDVESAALHLRLAAGLDGVRPRKWRDRFAKGATAARGRGDIKAAARFAEAALTLRGTTPLRDREVDRLILREALLAAADRDDPQTEARARALIETGRTDLERYQDYEVGIVALRLAEQNVPAWRLACEGLRAIGITPPPDRPALAFLTSAFLWWLTRRTARATTTRGENTVDAFTGVAAYAATIAYHRDPAAAAIIAFRGSLRADRASRAAAFWWSVDAFLFAALGAYRRAADAGERALAGFAEQRVLRAATLYQAMFFGMLWRRPLASLRDRFRDVVRIALGEGDSINASYGLRIFVMAGWRTSPSLDQLRDETIIALEELENIGEASFVDEMKAMAAMLDGLTGHAPWNPAVWRNDIPTRNHVIDLELSNLAGDWAETLRRAEALKPVRRTYNIQVDSVVLRFHESLARLRCGLRARSSDRRFVADAARLNPVDHRSKLLLLDAERLRLLRAPQAEVLDAYSAAVEAATDAASRLDEALALTCAADFATMIGHFGLARDYRHRANEVYAAWGLRIKTGASIAAEAEPLAEARARADAAERADRAKSRLLAHVGHELRTPLQALRAMLDLSKSSATSLDIEHVRSVLGSLNSVVEDLNIADEFIDQQTAGIVADVDLAELLSSEASIWHRDDRISLSLDPSPIRVQVAADRVRQIVRNLLSNAIKYGDEAPISIELKLEPLADAEVHVRIAVEDGGPGLSPDAIEALFNAFERGAFAGDGRGAGLGLALSRRIANRLGGTLDARNVGGGARFELQFVARRSIPSSAMHAAASAILLVEDSPLIRPLFAALLGHAGHRVVEAGTAREAIAAWDAGSFDLAILDLGLPDASGLTVLAKIRESGTRTADTPVILLTASTSREAEAIAESDAQVRALRKPASAETLYATVAALTRAPSSGMARPDAVPGVEYLYEAARTAVIEQARACLAGTPDERSLHQLAGLAAQFGWMEITHAVEALGTAIAAGHSPKAMRARLSAAIADMEAA